MKREFRENVFNCACKNWNTAGRGDRQGKKYTAKEKKKKRKKVFGFFAEKKVFGILRMKQLPVQPVIMLQPTLLPHSAAMVSVLL